MESRGKIMENIYKEAKIVVIDDVEEVLLSTKNCLEFEDMQVECFSSPKEIRQLQIPFTCSSISLLNDSDEDADMI